MEIGVVADIVMAERPDDIRAPSRFQNTGLLAHHLKRGTNAELVQLGGDSQRGIIRCRLDIVFRVEPQHHIHRPSRRKHGYRKKHQEQDPQHIRLD
jgi:hypothetical protein